MKAARFNEIMRSTRNARFSQRGLAAMFGYASHATPKQWATGQTQIPSEVADFLEKFDLWWKENDPRRPV